MVSRTLLGVLRDRVWLGTEDHVCSESGNLALMVGD